MKQILKNAVLSYAAKIVGYFLVSYNNATEMALQKLLIYPVKGYLLGGKMENLKMVTKVGSKDLMVKIFVKCCMLEVLLIWCYVRMTINKVIFNTLNLIPKVVSKMLSTKIDGADAWYYENRLNDKNFSEEKFYDHASSYVASKSSRVNWIQRIEDIKKLISVYKVRGTKLRNLINIITNCDMKNGKIRWNISIKWFEKFERKALMEAKDVIYSYIFKNFPYLLPETVEILENKYIKVNNAHVKGTLKKVNGEYVITLKYVHKIPYTKMVFDNVGGPIYQHKEYPSAIFFKYAFKKDAIVISEFEKATNVHQKFLFKLTDADQRDDITGEYVFLSESINPVVKHFCDLFIKVFEKLGINVPYVKQFSSLEQYFRYSYISENIYEIKDEIREIIDISKVDASNPSIMKTIWNKLKFPKSLRTAHANVLLMYLKLTNVDEANRIKYSSYFTSKIEELNSNSSYYLNRRIPSIHEMGLLIKILYKNKKSLLSNLDNISNMLVNDRHVVDTIWMLKKCQDDYPEELPGYLNRFKLDELHDKLTIELAMMRDREASIPYVYSNIFKDQKVFDLGSGYELRIPVNKLDLINLGNKLSICVGSSPVYHSMVKKGEGYIFMIYLHEKEYACIEYKNRILQAMLEYNIPVVQKDSFCYSKLEEFIKKYKGEITIEKRKIENDTPLENVEGDLMVIDEELPF